MLEVFLEIVQIVDDIPTNGCRTLKQLVITALLQFGGQEQSLFKNALSTIHPVKRTLLESGFKTMVGAGSNYQSSGNPTSSFESSSKAPKIQLKNFGEF
jgi:hypothetical protein